MTLWITEGDVVSLMHLGEAERRVGAEAVAADEDAPGAPGFQPADGCVYLPHGGGVGLVVDAPLAPLISEAR